MLADEPRETRNIKHTELSLQRKRCIACFLSSRLGMEVINSLSDLCTTCRAKPHLDPRGSHKQDQR